MSKVADALSEAVIDAPPEVVFKQILDLFEGVSHWHTPNTDHKHRENTPLGKVGAIYDTTIRGQFPVKLTSKITKIVDNKLIEFEEGGDFIGTATWIFEASNGKTNLKFRWTAHPKKLLFVLLFPFMNVETTVEKGHRESNEQGFKLMNDYLTKK